MSSKRDPVVAGARVEHHAGVDLRVVGDALGAVPDLVRQPAALPGLLSSAISPARSRNASARRVPLTVRRFDAPSTIESVTSIAASPFPNRLIVVVSAPTPPSSASGASMPCGSSGSAARAGHVRVDEEDVVAGLAVDVGRARDGLDRQAVVARRRRSRRSCRRGSSRSPRTSSPPPEAERPGARTRGRRSGPRVIGVAPIASPAGGRDERRRRSRRARRAPSRRRRRARRGR